MQAKLAIVMPKQSGKEALLAWLSAAVNKNNVRAAGGEGRGVLGLRAVLDGSSDGFAVGLTALCLRLTAWLQKDDLRKHVGLLGCEFYALNPHRSASGLSEHKIQARGLITEGLRAPRNGRWHDYGGQTALAGERIQQPLHTGGSFAPDRDPATAPHFATECFFLMQLAMHNCLLPAGEDMAVTHYSILTHMSPKSSMLIDLFARAVNRFEQAIQVAVRDWGVDTKEPQFLRRLQLFQDCTNAQLLDPGFAGEVVRFAFLEVSSHDGIDNAMSCVDESRSTFAESFI